MISVRMLREADREGDTDRERILLSLKLVWGDKVGYWNDIMNIPKMVEWGTISEKDLNMFIVTDSVEEAFDYLVGELEALEAAEAGE